LKTKVAKIFSTTNENMNNFNYYEEDFALVESKTPMMVCTVGVLSMAVVEVS